jgi:hypothetical protein
MNQTYNYFSRNSLIAIYLLLKALRKGVDEVVISGSCLYSFLKRERLYESVVFKFAKSFKPFFPDYGVTAYKDVILRLKKPDETEEKDDNTVKYDTFEIAQRRAKREMIKRWRVRSLPKPHEIDEELIAKEVAECIFKYKTIKSVVSEKNGR